MNDKITVIVPVYNVQEYLAKCIESITGQSYENLEIILVNDGSTDDCGSICDYYAQKDTRIKVIHKKNGGLSDARNAGIEAATGEFIGFVDSDDWIDCDMYKTMYNLIIENQADISICRMRKIYNSEVVDNSTGNVIVCDGITAIEKMFTLKEVKYRFEHAVMNKLIKRELLANMRFPVGALIEDLYFTPKLFYAIKRCVYLDVAKYNYLAERPGSIMNVKLHEKIIFDELNAIKEVEQFLANKVNDNIKILLKEYYLTRVMYYYCRLKSSTIENKENILIELKQLFLNNNNEKQKKSMSVKAIMKINLFQFSSSFYHSLDKILKGTLFMIKKWKARNGNSKKLLNELV